MEKLVSEKEEGSHDVREIWAETKNIFIICLLFSQLVN